MKISFLLFVFLFFAIDTIQAQEEIKIGGFVGLALPMGDFAGTEHSFAEDEVDGFAKTGFTLGLDVKVPLGTPGLRWQSTLGIAVNAVDVDKFFFHPLSKGDATPYISVPLFTGLSYQGRLFDDLEIYGLGQIGLNFHWSTNLEFFDGYYDLDENRYIEFKSELKTDMATSFGFAIGGGLVICKRITVDLRYWSLGKPDVKGTLIEFGASQTVDPFDKSISILVCTVGLIF